MDQESFYQQFTARIQEMHPDKPIPNIQPTDNLYELGFIDSLNMVEVIIFLESMLGNPISIENFQIRNFYTMNSIFDTFFTKEIVS